MVAEWCETQSSVKLDGSSHTEEFCLNETVCLWMTIYAPPWGLSTLAKELSGAASVMQISSKESSTLVADRV